MALIPARYAFRPVAECRRIGQLEPFQIVSPTYLLTGLIEAGEDEWDEPFANAYAGWTDEELRFGFQANLRRPPKALPNRWWEGDCVELFLDLRGSLPRDRYTEHCVHFFLLPGAQASAGRCEPAVEYQVAVQNDETVRVDCDVFPRGYRLDATLTRQAIPTFDPIRHKRIGFNYIIREAGGRTQRWTAGQELDPFRDPSVWGLLELVE